MRVFSNMRQNKILKYANSVYQNIPEYYNSNGQTVDNATGNGDNNLL